MPVWLPIWHGHTDPCLAPGPHGRLGLDHTQHLLVGSGHAAGRQGLFNASGWLGKQAGAVQDL